MKEFESLLQSLTPELVEVLKQAVEVGHWNNGTQLTDQQKESAIQALMAYEARQTVDKEDSEPFKIDSTGQLKVGKNRIYKSKNDFSEDPNSIKIKMKP